MKRFLSLFAILVAIIAVSCYDDVVPVKEFHDTDKQIFLENGRMVDATTKFTQQQLENALLRCQWKRDYAFYYDKEKAGPASEIHYWDSDVYYVFKEDGTAQFIVPYTSNDIINYRYNVQGRVITLVGESQTYVMRVVALDTNRLVVDTDIDSGDRPANYDAATVKCRIIFRPRNL